MSLSEHSLTQTMPWRLTLTSDARLEKRASIIAFFSGKNAQEKIIGSHFRHMIEISSSLMIS